MVGDLQLFAVVNRIGNDVIKSVTLQQESHNDANVVRNVVLLSQRGADFEPAGFGFKNTKFPQTQNVSHMASPIHPDSTASCTNIPRESSQTSHVMGELEEVESNWASSLL